MVYYLIGSLPWRYSSAYDKIRKRAFWDVASSGGPVVEQATHFIDLLRFFGGEIVIDSVKATAVGPKYQLTSMAEPPYAEHEVDYCVVIPALNILHPKH